ncbi:MAG: beta-ketoacyl-[acyl-carrier-protein] synthase family protein [Candidatus Competibacterales bacterium]
MSPLLVSAYTATSAMGWGLSPTLQALVDGRSALRPCDFADAILDTWIGRVAGVEEQPVTGALGNYDCRNNRIAQLALQQDDFQARVAALARRWGPRRVGVFIGTSTSGIGATEWAYAHRDPTTGTLPESFDYRCTHNVFSVADFTRRHLGLEGPCAAISTACSSSAKVFASAQRHICAGLCDAAVVGGVDSLCLTTLYGFNALELVSAKPCRPWDAERDGLNIGEGGGFALLERSPDHGHPDHLPGGIYLLGYGESSDAHHMSAPHPEGKGAASAMERALASAGLAPSAIDYVNLHGTATPSNDAAEDRAMATVFPQGVACSSTKGWTGHTLGAAGILEAVFACLAVEHGFIPQSLNTQRCDPNLHTAVALEPQRRPVARVLSNSFGFGGTNCSLVLGRLS